MNPRAMHTSHKIMMKIEQKAEGRVAQREVVEAEALEEEEIVWNALAVAHGSIQSETAINPPYNVITDYQTAPHVAVTIVARVAGLRTPRDALIQR